MSDYFDDDKVLCKITTRGDGNEWSITFPKPIYDFLVAQFGDVHKWAAQQYDLIVAGQMKSPESVLAMRKVRQGEVLSQLAIGDLIRRHASSLAYNAEEGL